jgi:hypothetical protein
MADENCPADTEMCQCALHERAVLIEMRAEAQPVGAAMTRDIERNNTEAERCEPSERLRVQQRLDTKAVHDDERDTATGDGDTNTMTVVEVDDMAREANRRREFE